MSLPPFLTIKELSISFGIKPLLVDLELNVTKGDRYCLVGRNGSGKSTLMKILCGFMEPDHVDSYKEPGLRVCYLPQESHVADEQTILDFVLQSGCEPYEALSYLDQLELDPNRLGKGLSGGENRKASLAKMLSKEADLYLIDEPTNHLDMATIEWLEQELARKTFIVISHDRKFLNTVSNKILWLDRGKLHVHKKGGYSQFDDFYEAYLQEEERQMEKLDVKLKEELHWLHRGVTARRKRNQGRLRALNTLRDEKRNRLLNQAQKIKLGGGVETDISSKLVAEVVNISKTYDGKPVVKNFTTRILRGDRVGILGPNGAGKTSLLRLLMGLEKPDEGRVKLGDKIDLIYFDQMRDRLKPQETLWENLCETGGDQVMIGGKHRHVVAYLKDFMFDDKQAKALVSTLSGGEKNRLALAKSLTQTGNVLVLDEPTNDLDMDTLDLLQDILSDYDGTLLIVSHDRDFLDRMTSSIIAVEGQGYVQEYVGGYDDYLRQRTYPTWFKKQEKGTPKKTPKQTEKESCVKKPPSKRLTYNQQRDYELLPKEIESLIKERNELEFILGDSTLYTKDPHKFQRLSDHLEHLKTQIDQKEDRWLELELFLTSDAS